MTVQYEQHHNMNDNLQMLERAIVEKNSDGYQKESKDKNGIAYPHFKMLNDIKTRFLGLTIEFNEKKKKIKFRAAILTFGINESVILSGFIYGLINHKWFESLFLIMLVFNTSLGLGAALIDKEAYPFIYRWLKKKSHQTQIRQKIDSYRNEISALIHQQNFQHAYLTHLQMMVHNYENLCEDMGNNQMTDFNLFNTLTEKIQQLKLSQSSVMNDFINERDGLEVFDEIYKIETEINSINLMLGQNETVKQKQQKFIQRHHDFLHNQGFDYLLDKNSPVHLKTLL
jgi:hypothetical protein